MRGGGGSTADRETSAGAVDEHHRGIPAEPLRPYVAAYTGYRQRGVPPARHRGLPSPFLTLIFTLDDPLVLAQHVRADRAPSRFDALLGGCTPPPRWCPTTVDSPASRSRSARWRPERCSACRPA